MCRGQRLTEHPELQQKTNDSERDGHKRNTLRFKFTQLRSCRFKPCFRFLNTKQCRLASCYATLWYKICKKNAFVFKKYLPCNLISDGKRQGGRSHLLINNTTWFQIEGGFREQTKQFLLLPV